MHRPGRLPSAPVEMRQANGPDHPESRDRIVGFIDSGEAQGAEIRVDGRGLVVPGLRTDSLWGQR